MVSIDQLEGERTLLNNPLSSGKVKRARKKDNKSSLAILKSVLLPLQTYGLVGGRWMKDQNEQHHRCVFVDILQLTMIFGGHFSSNLEFYLGSVCD